MTTLYKLTDQRGKTLGGMLWEEGCINRVEPCNNPQLCSGDVLHAYRNLNLGLLLNPEHANINNPRIWKCLGNVAVEDWGKVGCFELEIIEELKQPKWYKDIETRNKVVIQFAILCAQEVLSIFEDRYPDDLRPRQAIEAAQEYLNNPSSTAADAADAAAYAAADAAYAAAYAAADAAAYAAAYAAARAAAYAADAAAYAAADAAADTKKEIDFSRLADLAVEIVTK